MLWFYFWGHATECAPCSDGSEQETNNREQTGKKIKDKKIIVNKKYQTTGPKAKELLPQN